MQTLPENWLIDDPGIIECDRLRMEKAQLERKRVRDAALAEMKRHIIVALVAAGEIEAVGIVANYRMPY